MKLFGLLLVLLSANSNANLDSLFNVLSDSLIACKKDAKKYSEEMVGRKSADSLYKRHLNLTESMLLAQIYLPGENVDKQLRSKKGIEGLLTRISKKHEELNPQKCLVDSNSATTGKCWEFILPFLERNAVSLVKGEHFQAYLDTNFDEAERRYNPDSGATNQYLAVTYIVQWMKKAAELIENYQSNKIEMSSFYRLPYLFMTSDRESVKAACFDERFQKIRNKYYNYQFRTDSITFKHFQKRIAELSKTCYSAIGGLCSSVFFLKEKAIFSYATQGCDVREVTAGDLQKDIDEWKSVGIEEARILQHSELLDEVQFCQEANDNQYSWRYERPTVEKGCNPPKKK